MMVWVIFVSLISYFGFQMSDIPTLDFTAASSYRLII